MTTTIPGRDPSTLTMSSREIAALVESRHDKVKQSIERLAERGLISFTPVGETSHEGPGARPVTVYRVNKRDSYIVVAQLSPEFTARLVDRWQELEEQSQFGFTVPKSMPEALRLAADLAEQKAALEARIAADQPKVAFAEAVRHMDDTCTIEEFAKALGTGRNRLFKWLRAQDILLKNNLPYQRYIDCGWFKVVELKPWYDSDGNAHPEFSARITGKGQVGLESRYRNEHRNGLVLIKGGVAS